MRGNVNQSRCLQAPKSIKPGKTPGSDDLLIELYKVL